MKWVEEKHTTNKNQIEELISQCKRDYNSLLFIEVFGRIPKIQRVHGARKYL
jgi:hypothetical protein